MYKVIEKGVFKVRFKGVLVLLGALVLITQPDLGGKKSLFKKIEMQITKKEDSTCI